VILGRAIVRTTWLTFVSLERKAPYDPDFHGLVDQRVDLKLHSEESKRPDVRIRIELTIKFMLKSTGDQFGRISARAESLVTGMAIPRAKNRKIDWPRTSQEFRRVLDGAVGEDLLIPLSVMARAAHLPSLLPIPSLFTNGRSPEPAPGVSGPKGAGRLRPRKPKRVG
jgi:hypothetical protein